MLFERRMAICLDEETFESCAEEDIVISGQSPVNGFRDLDSTKRYGAPTHALYLTGNGGPILDTPDRITVEQD
jgi:hypothetical protein